MSTTGTDADYVVNLIDVFPDQLSDYPENEKDVPMGGYQMLVRGDAMRGKYRNSFELPEPFIPGKVTEVFFELPDIAHTFKKGHLDPEKRIMFYEKLLQYGLPRLQATEISNVFDLERLTDKELDILIERLKHE